MKKHFTLFVALVVFATLKAQVPSNVPTNGLLAYYTFDNTFLDQSVNANHSDSVGAPNNIFNRFITGRDGVANHALLCDNNCGAKIDLGLYPQMKPDSFISISMWVYTDAQQTNSYPTALSLVNADNSLNTFILGASVSPPPMLNAGVGTFSSPATAYASVGISAAFLASWHHVVLTYDGADVKLFLDGALQATTPKTGLLDYSTAISYIGIGNHYFGFGFTGRIDDVAFYNRALTGAEVSQMNAAPCVAPDVTNPFSVSGGLCPGTSTTFGPVVSAGNNLTYQWLKGGQPISGATNNTYTINSLSAATHNADYRVVVSNNCGVDTSTVYSLSVHTVPAATFTANGNVLTCNVSAESYQWYLDGVVIPSSNSSQITATQTGEYRVEIFTADGCSSISNPQTITMVGINEAAAHKLSVYPNPTAELLMITCDEPIESAEVYSIAGERVMRASGTITSLNVAGLAAGTYLLNATTSKGNIKRTFIKE